MWERIILLRIIAYIYVWLQHSTKNSIHKNKNMKLTFLTIKYAFFVFTTLAITIPKSVVAQDYFNLNELMNLSTSEFSNVYDIADLANQQGYYANELQGTYKDNYGNELSFYKYEGTVYIDYKIKATANAIALFKSDIEDKTYFMFNSNDGKTKYYRSPNGRFSFSIVETKLTWEFTVSENKKGDPSPAYAFEKNKIEVNSYTTYSNIFIKKGDKVYLKATGAIKYGPLAGSGGPEGIDGYEFYSANANFKHGSLLGKIGEDGNWFLIGSYKTFTANDSGKLFLMVNDADPSNNEGSFYIEYGINNEIKPD